MPHLVNPMFDVSYAVAIQQLETAHSFLVQRAREATAISSLSASKWGIEVKRLVVDLDTANRPALIGKQNERFGEVVNMVATIERLIPALQWFCQDIYFQQLRVRECHPSASDKDSGNDLVLVNSAGAEVVRCEVCDVASDRASSNGKEKKDIHNLGCDNGVPQDGIARFICTAREFARALTSRHRKWSGCAYRYQLVELRDSADTCMLRVIPKPAAVTS
jgi:hypothetical protein